MKRIPEVAVNILSHIDVYINQLEDVDYSKPLPLLSDATIGGHTRHIIDGFLCLMNQQESGVISYDKRERNKQLETDTQYVSEKLTEIRLFLRSLENNRSCGFEIKYEDQTFLTDSTLSREIAHNIEHVIHHLAIIKIALMAYYKDVNLPREFGVAPSTLRYWEANLIDQ